MGLIKSNIRRNKIMPALVKTMFSTREKTARTGITGIMGKWRSKLNKIAVNKL